MTDIKDVCVKSNSISGESRRSYSYITPSILQETWRRSTGERSDGLPNGRCRLGRRGDVTRRWALY